MTARAPDADRLNHLRYAVIPYYVQGVRAGISALDLSAKHDPLTPLELHLDGVEAPVYSTILTAHTQTASSIAALYSRLLLEFLGLKSTGKPSALVTIQGRKNGDIGIEHYVRDDDSALSKLDPSCVDYFADSSNVERAWIVTCDFAGQRLAHVTDDYKLDGLDVTPMLRRTFETIPELVSHAFFAVANTQAMRAPPRDDFGL
ncbi:hypothetical protein [Trinickia dinghuensis]|uniref:Uncharacterized protein n=1 Tax=Trinickia dinghuensis TaxID=2291023 RepID=A0A3D8JYA5_9BURK|nr:hypothetical protein [Trinickia dinghuensis]RDU97860.1 hypothetical protein DWV00_15005 [Trinickia dinghuensis]